MCLSIPGDFEGGWWDLIVLSPDHCLSVYFYKFLSEMMENVLSIELGGILTFC